MQVAHSAAALLAASPLRPQPEQVNVKEKYLQNSSIGDFVTHSLRTLLLDIRNHWNVLLKTDQQLLHEGIEQFLLEIFLRLRLKLVAQRPTPGLVGHSLAVGFVRAVLSKGLLTPILMVSVDIFYEVVQVDILIHSLLAQVDRWVSRCQLLTAWGSFQLLKKNCKLLPKRLLSVKDELTSGPSLANLSIDGKST